VTFLSDKALKLVEECQERSKVGGGSARDLLLAELCARCDSIASSIMAHLLVLCFVLILIAIIK
jgi:hypothetical protein